MWSVRAGMTCSRWFRREAIIPARIDPGLDSPESFFMIFEDARHCCDADHKVLEAIETIIGKSREKPS
jgi:hypothetical protein